MRSFVRKSRRTTIPFYLWIAFAMLSVLILVTSAHASDDGSDSGRPQQILQDQGVFVFRQGSNGEFVCEQAKTEDIRALSKRSDTSVNLTPLPSLNASQDLTGLRIILRATDYGAGDLGYVAGVFFTVNVLLASFNAIPLPPLDGYKIMIGILPRFWTPVLAPLERYGFMILFLIFFLGSRVGSTSLTDEMIDPVQNLLVRFLL